MMNTEPEQKQMLDVPKQVFEKFLHSLGEAGVSVEWIDRVRKILLEEKKFTERALKEAILPAEPRR